MKRIFLALPILTLSAAAAWFGYGTYLASTLPNVEIRSTTALAVNGEKTLPFYELMSPLPPLTSHQMIPRLDYKKGPPVRFIERITVMVQSSKKGPKERIVYHGRRTRRDFPGISFFPNGEAREARYIEAALRISQGEASTLGRFEDFLLRPFLLREAGRWLKGVETVTVMEQAGTPAFFFESGIRPEGRIKSSALFVRRNSLYKVDYTGDQGFIALDPRDLFRKSFLTERRADALDYLAKNLSEVRMEQTKVSEVRSIVWPILLLAANVSVDPSSLEAYFHFAGISALLYRSVSMDSSDREILDVLRNNVLASEFYARDVNPSARKTAEISRLARLLTRNFE
jgi:hypothetical protein